MSESPIDPAVLRELESSTDPAFVQELLRTFLDDSTSLISSIRHSLDEGNAAAVRNASHSLKSNSATVGAPKLSALAQSMEAQAKAGDLKGMDSALSDLAAEFERVRDALRKWPHDH